MPVDTTMYGAPPPTNVMQTLGGAAGIMNSLNQNRLFNQQFQSNVALSNAAKQSVDDQGNFDPAKYRALVAGGPAGYMLPQAVEQSQQIQKGQIDINQSQYNLLKDHLTTLSNYLGPLAQGIPTGQKDQNGNPVLRDPTGSDVATTIGHAITTGVATPQEGANIWATLPRDQQGNVDPTQVKAWAMNQLQRVQGAAQQYGIVNPAPTPVSTGGQTHLIVAPQVGVPRDVGQIANTLPPTTPTVGPGNVPQALGPTSSALQVPAPVAPPPTPAPAAASPPGTSPSPLANAMPGTGPSAASPGPAPTANGRVQTGLAPGVSEAATETAGASAKQGVTLQQAADQVPQQKALLGNLEGALNAFTPGPGSKWTNETGALFNRAIQAMGGKGVATDSVSAQEEFNKQALQLAQSQFQALGGTGTDAKLDSTMHTSPNAALSKLGNQGIINLLKGNADAIAVKNREWQQYQQEHGPQSYGQFSTQFNKAYDPRVFASAYMSAPDKQRMISGMSKPEQAQFRQSYNFAVQNGWVPDPRQQAQANGGQ